MKKVFLWLAAAVLLAACGEKDTERMGDLHYDGPNLSDVLFSYYPDHYTDTYRTTDGKVEIRAEYEFYSSWGCISYYLRIEKSIRKTVQDMSAAEVLDFPQETAVAAEDFFNRRYSSLRFKLRQFRFVEVRQVE